MAQSGSAARRYAEAMLDLALAANAVDAFRASFDQLSTALTPETLDVLRDPGRPVVQRLAAVAAAAKSEPSEIRALLGLLVRRDRVALFPAIAKAYGALVDRRGGIVEARITTAIELPQGERDSVVKRLAASSGKNIRATFATDPALLGGAKVQVGDRLVDGSLRAQLESLRVQLAS